MKIIGIPNKNKKSELPTYENEKLEFGLHEHFADRAGKHYDLRLGDPKTKKAYSWAIRHWPAPGERRLAIRQPDHTIAYMDWSGIIPSGYGAGKVNLKQRSVAENVMFSKDKITFKVDGVLFTLINTGGDNWLILNRG